MKNFFKNLFDPFAYEEITLVPPANVPKEHPDYHEYRGYQITKGKHAGAVFLFLDIFEAESGNNYQIKFYLVEGSKRYTKEQYAEDAALNKEFSETVVLRIATEKLEEIAALEEASGK